MKEILSHPFLFNLLKQQNPEFSINNKKLINKNFSFEDLPKEINPQILEDIGIFKHFYYLDLITIRGSKKEEESNKIFNINF